MNTLKDTSVGKTVKVVKLHGDGPLKRRVMDMGITKSVDIYVRKVAPLGDPIDITVRGYELSIRRADAEIVEVEEAAKRAKPSAPATQPSRTCPASTRSLRTRPRRSSRAPISWTTAPTR